MRDLGNEPGSLMLHGIRSSLFQIHVSIKQILMCGGKSTGTLVSPRAMS
jgi:hypothetical protein